MGIDLTDQASQHDEAAATGADTVHYRTCPLCEATCGLEITMRGDSVLRIRGDRDDVFSHGFICPKGSTLKQFHDDPDRLRAPLVKRDGVHVEVTWDEAYAEVERLLTPILAFVITRRTLRPIFEGGVRGKGCQEKMKGLPPPGRRS